MNLWPDELLAQELFKLLVACMLTRPTLKEYYVIDSVILRPLGPHRFHSFSISFLSTREYR